MDKLIISEDEFMEWHSIVKAERDKYKSALESIRFGSCPIIYGMASEYRKMKREELMKIAEEALK